jgi:pantoate--beta-alanine ligase
VRAADGLALSSRNGYLSEDQRAAAPALYRVIKQIGDAVRSGEPNHDQLLSDGVRALESAGFRPDYLEIRNAVSLRPATPEDQDLVVLGAAFLGKTRLIDNLHLIKE